MNLGPNSPFWAVFFWVNVAVCSVLAIVVVRIVCRYEARRKRFEIDVNDSGLKDVKWLFKHKLKEHGIDENDKTNSSN